MSAKRDSYQGIALLQALARAGVPLHDNTRSAELEFTLEGPAILRIEIVVDAPLLHQIATATAAFLVAERLVER